jgi:hypothetical protein
VEVELELLKTYDGPPPVVELTRFRVKPEQVDDLLMARPGVPDDFRADRANFIDAHPVRLPDEGWLDVVWLVLARGLRGVSGPEGRSS